MLTPDDIRAARFPIAPRGYAMPAVDQFLDSLLARVETGQSTADADARRRVRELEALTQRLQQENRALKEQLATRRAARAEEPPSVLERAYERMAQLTESHGGKTIHASKSSSASAQEEPLAGIESSLESSLFRDDS